MVQIADIPALRGPVGTRGLRGFLPGQAYSLTAEQIVDNPFPRRGFDEGLQGFHLRTEFSSEFGADRSHSSSARCSSGFFKSARYGVQGFFSHFSTVQKKAKIPRTQLCESAPEVELMASTSLVGVLV